MIIIVMSSIEESVEYDLENAVLLLSQTGNRREFDAVMRRLNEEVLQERDFLLAEELPSDKLLKRFYIAEEKARLNSIRAVTNKESLVEKFNRMKRTPDETRLNATSYGPFNLFDKMPGRQADLAKQSRYEFTTTNQSFYRETGDYSLAAQTGHPGYSKIHSQIPIQGYNPQYSNPLNTEVLSELQFRPRQAATKRGFSNKI